MENDLIRQKQTCPFVLKYSLYPSSLPLINFINAIIGNRQSPSHSPCTMYQHLRGHFILRHVKLQKLMILLESVVTKSHTACYFLSLAKIVEQLIILDNKVGVVQMVTSKQVLAMPLCKLLLLQATTG